MKERTERCCLPLVRKNEGSAAAQAPILKGGIPPDQKNLPNGSKIKIVKTTTSKVMKIRLTGPDVPSAQQAPHVADPEECPCPSIGNARGHPPPTGQGDPMNVRPR